MFRREPALWIGAINTLLALAAGFGLQQLSPTRIGLINATAAALLALYTRSQVSPAATATAQNKPANQGA